MFNKILNTMLIIVATVFMNVAVAEKVTYFVNDVLGSPVQAYDQNANKLWTEEYKPFGDKIRNPASNKNDVGYTGHQSDDDVGLTYMQARYYDPEIGRFYSIDPVDFTGDVSTFNRYAYAGNNPYKYTDPDGRTRRVKLPSELKKNNILSQAAGEQLLKVLPDGSLKDLVQTGVDGLKVINSSGKRRGMNNSKVKSAVVKGKQEHKKFAEKVEQKSGWQSEPQSLIDPSTGKKVIPDAVTPSGHPVELKPNTPSGRRQGKKQLPKYERATGKKGKVIYYESK